VPVDTEAKKKKLSEREKTVGRMCLGRRTVKGVRGELWSEKKDVMEKKKFWGHVTWR